MRFTLELNERETALASRHKGKDYITILKCYLHGRRHTYADPPYWLSHNTSRSFVSDCATECPENPPLGETLILIHTLCTGSFVI